MRLLGIEEESSVGCLTVLTSRSAALILVVLTRDNAGVIMDGIMHEKMAQNITMRCTIIDRQRELLRLPGLRATGLIHKMLLYLLAQADHIDHTRLLVEHVQLLSRALLITFYFHTL